MTTKSNTPSKIVTPDAFHIGAAVWVCNERTNNTPAAGTIATTAKGWYNILLDEVPEGGKPTVSARINSLQPRKTEQAASPEANEEVEDSTSSGDPIEESLDELDEEAENLRASAHGMKEALRHARAHYVKAKRPNGTATAHNGDFIARALAELEPIQVAMFAEVFLGLPKTTLTDKYSRLNPGQIRMNSGNRIRSAIRKLNDAKEAATESADALKLADEYDRLSAILEEPFAAVQAWFMAEPGTAEYEIITEEELPEESEAA